MSKLFESILRLNEDWYDDRPSRPQMKKPTEEMISQWQRWGENNIKRNKITPPGSDREYDEEVWLQQVECFTPQEIYGEKNVAYFIEWYKDTPKGAKRKCARYADQYGRIFEDLETSLSSHAGEERRWFAIEVQTDDEFLDRVWMD